MTVGPSRFRGARWYSPLCLASFTPPPLTPHTMQAQFPWLAAVTATALAATGLAQTRVEQPQPAPLVRKDLSALEGLERENFKQRAAGRAARAPMEVIGNSHLLAGEPISVGPDYKALYDTSGVTFFPLLGPDAPRTHRVSFAFESASVGGTELQGLDLAVEPQLVDGQVTYFRGHGLSETYEALRSGLEQSFVFEELPSRAGDLVVRGQLTSSLGLPSFSDSKELRFEESGIGGVRVDTVIGIDADGERVPGTLRSSGTAFELTLPAEFIARAALPLVLDPIFGTQHQITSGANFDAREVDVAYADAFSEYAFVYSRFFSQFDPDITVALRTADNVEFLVPFAIESDILTLDKDPAIAYNRFARSFVVVWEREDFLGAGTGDIFFTTFEDVFGAVQPRITVGQGTHPDVGGDLLESQVGNDAVVVWEDSGIFSLGVQVSNVLPPIPSSLGIQTVSSSSDSGNPSITSQPGVNGRHGLVYTLDFGTDFDLAFHTITAEGAVISPREELTTIGPHEFEPDITGDGEEFAVVYTREAILGNGDGDILFQKFTLDTTAAPVLGDSLMITSGLNDNETKPTISRSGNDYLIAFHDEFLNSSIPEQDLFVTTVSKLNCEICEPQTLIQIDVSPLDHPETAAAAEDSSSSQEAVIAFVGLNTVDAPEISFQAWQETEAQAPINLGGGCGANSTITFEGLPEIGNSITLGAQLPQGPAFLAILNIAAGGNELPCGSCVFLPFDLTLVSPLVPFFGQDVASMSIAIPCTPSFEGAEVDFQWTFVGTTESPCFLGPEISLSDRLRATLSF